jgi:hypothetical protein
MGESFAFRHPLIQEVNYAIHCDPRARVCMPPWRTRSKGRSGGA